MTKRTRSSRFNLDSSSDEGDDYSGFLSSSSEDSDNPRFRRDEETGALVQVFQDEKSGKWYTVDEWKAHTAQQVQTGVC